MKQTSYSASPCVCGTVLKKLTPATDRTAGPVCSSASLSICMTVSKNLAFRADITVVSFIIFKMCLVKRIRPLYFFSLFSRWNYNFNTLAVYLLKLIDIGVACIRTGCLTFFVFRGPVQFVRQTDEDRYFH